MDSTFIITILTTGFAVAAAHAMIPTHWLPFVLAGRAQHWSRSRILSVVAIAGGAHVAFTTLLGALIVWFGIRISEDIGRVFLLAASGALFLIGAFYIVRHIRGKGGEHHHSLSRLWEKHDHDEEEGHAHSHDGMAIGSLIAMLTFSPCEGFLPVYLSGVPYGWRGFLLLSVTLAAATLGSMIFLAWLTSIGIERMRHLAIEKYESLLIGSLLCLLGIAVYLFEH